MTSKLTITCDGCGKEISMQAPAQYLMLSASTLALLLEPKHFCNTVCLHAWVERVLKYDRGLDPLDEAAP